MDVAKIIDAFKDAAEDPCRQAQQWKEETKGKAVGFLLTDVPEELIYASGFLPFGIAGGSSRLDLAKAHLQNWTCSFIRSSLALALEKKLDFLDGLIIPQTCDTTRMVFGVWKHVSPLPFFQNFRMPRQVERPSAREYLIGELVRLKRLLEEFRGEEISDEELKKSIRLYNQNRALLRELYTLHEENPRVIKTRDLYTIIKASMVMPREKVNELLNHLVNAVKQGARNSYGEQIRLIISGTLLQPLELLDYLEEERGIVVGDDLQDGFRYIEKDVDENIDPMEALALRQLNRMPFAGYDKAKNPRRFFLVNLAEQKKAQGVIFLHLKYCEPENYDYYDNFLALEKAQIPSIRLETEFGTTSLGQLRTRIQAFLEMVGGER